jgi:hypothetical protein
MSFEWNIKINDLLSDIIGVIIILIDQNVMLIIN